MLTYQDFTAAKSEGRLIPFLARAIQEHRASAAYQTAVDADEYNAQRNVTIRSTVKTIYKLAGSVAGKSNSVTQATDFTASNQRIASNFFKRLNTQRCTYSLGNGVTFDSDGMDGTAVKDRLGPKFDTDLYRLAYRALIHGQAFGFWNVDRLHIFPLTEFVPLIDEFDGALRAGIRFWSIEWGKRPVSAVLYEEDGFTRYRSREGINTLDLMEIEPKRGYKQTIIHTEAGGDEIIGEENYGSLPIIPLYGNEIKQSTLVGMRDAIDSYDLIQSGFANDLEDCAQIYWIISGAMGMSDDDIQRFLDRIRLGHAAVVDTDNSNVTPYTQDVPYSAREAYLNSIRGDIYSNFGAFNPVDITSRQVTATEINAAYQPIDEEADAFEYQVIEFCQRLLALMGIQGATPQFKRNRISNQTEQVDMILAEAQYLDTETILELLPNITTDMVPEILARLDVAQAARTPEAPPDVLTGADDEA